MILSKEDIKNGPLLCGVRGTVNGPELDSAILQSLEADYPAPQSLFGLAPTAVPSGTDDRWRVP